MQQLIIARGYVLGESARRDILDLQAICGEAPSLDPEEHIRLNLNIAAVISSLRSNLRRLQQDNQKALQDRFGPVKSTPRDPAQGTLDQALASQPDVPAAEADEADSAASEGDPETEKPEGRPFGGTIVEAPPQSRDGDALDDRADQREPVSHVRRRSRNAARE